VRRFLGNISWFGLLSGVLCGLTAWLVVQIPVAHDLEEWMSDASFFFRGQRETKTKIIIVGIDDPSLAALPKPLVYISPDVAEVVTYLSDKKVSAIGLDLLIPKDLAGWKELNKDGKGDVTKLGQAIADAGTVVLPELKQGPIWEQPLPQLRLKEFRDPDPKRLDLGFVNLTEDYDRVLRCQQLVAEGRVQFALAVYARARHLEVQVTDGRLSVGGQTVPLDDQGKLRINFVGPPGTFQAIAFRDVLAAARSGRSLPVDFADAIVILGITAESQTDLHLTPYANNFWRNLSARNHGLMAGPEVHANILATLGDGAYIRPVAWLSSLPMMLVFGALSGIGLQQLNRLQRTFTFLLVGLALVLTLNFAWKFVCMEAFRQGNLRIEILPLALLGWFAFVGNCGVRWFPRRGSFRAAQPAEKSATGLDPQPETDAGKLLVIQQLLPDLADDLQALQHLPSDDVPSALNKIRFITERIVHGVCLEEKVTWGDAEPTLERMLGPVTAKGLLPKNVAIHVRTIQANTSPGSHYQPVPLSESHLAIAKRALIEVLGWYASVSKSRLAKDGARNQCQG
jgi:CHASE2 domain-containing sensor protein